MLIPYFSNPTDIRTAVFRLVLSFILAFIIGFEREHSNQPAGLRTHILISIGSTVFMLVSLIIPRLDVKGFQADPTRIAAQIVTGIGFLGAGAILKIGINVKGLTTAANMWVVCAMGMSVGAGLYLIAFIITAAALITLIPLNHLEKYFIKHRHRKKLHIAFKGSSFHLDSIRKILSDHKIEITNIDYSRSAEESSSSMVISLKYRGNPDAAQLFSQLSDLPHVSRIELTQLEEL